MTRAPRAVARRNTRAILDAAARVLTADDTASMQAIADAAGLARLTLYRHFPTREALIEAMTTEMIGDMRRAAEEVRDRAAAHGLSGADGIASLLGELACITTHYPSILGPQPGHPTADQQAFRDGFTALVRLGQDDGSIDPGVDPVFLRQAALGGLASLLHCAPEGESELVDPGATIASLLLSGARARG